MNPSDISGQIALSFIGFLCIFTLVGLAAVLQRRGTRQDYYLADSSIKPWLVGLSAVATNNSGYMFIGVIGYTYTTGLASVWLMTGWIIGDFLASRFVHERLRRATTATDEASYGAVLSSWQGDRQLALRRLIGIISLVFLLTYASAQLVAGSKALHVLFDWPIWLGAVIGSVIVTLYCFVGGIRASIWTDAAQSFVMFVAMATLLWVAVDWAGGISQTIAQMQEIDGFLDWFPKDTLLPGAAGAGLFVVSWLFAGMSVIGQPHIMVRFMALDDANNMGRARAWYYLWFTAFYCLATGVGMLSRLYISDTVAFDAELALPTMAMGLLPPLLVGLILAGVFAATMSTADSLILSCSAAVTQDLLPKPIENPLLIKASTVGIAMLALLLAISNTQSVFSLVIMAWAALASAFAPLLLALCLGQRPAQSTSIVAVLSGVATVVLWHYLEWQALVYEGLPGIIVGALVLWLGSIVQRRIPAVSPPAKSIRKG